MELQRNEARVSVLWRGKEYVVEISSDINLKDFGIELQKMTNIKADTMRLIVPQSFEKSSKLLSPFSEEHSPLSLQETSILHAKTIRMMGALEVEVDEVVKNAKADQRIAGFDQEENRIRQRITNRTHNSLKLPQGKYIFSQFRTLQLPGIELNPPPSEALKRMHVLAADPGIVAIMNKHRWRVGIMTEMAPVGYVGVSPMCILGFNKNQGEEISLRLRTDDLKGFRKYESIKKTLLHELAHMIYSEHDAKFYALDKQLNLEAASLDWTKSGGHTVNGFRDSNRYEEDFDVVESSLLSQKLGGHIPHEFANARESSVAAAYIRLSNESTNSSKACEVHEEPDPDSVSELLAQEKMMIEDLHIQLDGNNKSDHHVSHNQNLDEPDPDEYEGVESMNSETFVETNEIKITSEPSDDAEMIQVVSPKTKEDSDPRVNNLEKKNSQSEAYTEPDPDESQTIENVHGEPDTDDEEMRRIQDPVTALCNRLRNVINTLQSEVNPTQTTTVLQTLFKIIRNVIEHPNEIKFKRLRMANPVIQRNVANYKAAMEFLFMIGFNEDIVHNEIGKAETYLVLKRNDPGLLWLAKSSLETCIAY